MDKTTFHHLETNDAYSTFDHVAVNGDACLISVAHMRVTFNLQTAEQIVDILGQYVEDNRRMRKDYFSEIDRINDDIARKNEEAINGL